MTENIDPIKIDRVKDRTGLSKPTIYRLMRTGRFPKQMKTSDNTVAWVKSEVDGWLAERAAAREVQ
jgi:prophage regulatory protein